MAENVLKMLNINKIYGTTIKNQVLFDISLDISSGTFLSLIGPSGSGKSTLLNILGTLDKPSSGELFIDGRFINALTENQLADFRNKTLGFIFQFHYLFPDFTALENVLMPYIISHTGKPDSKIIEHARELLEKVGIEDKTNDKIINLSGGQQQRVAIARSLINNPKLILADEPTGSLDTETANQILELLKEINKEMGTTFVIVTHDPSIATRSDRIIELVDGKVSRDFLNNENGQGRANGGLDKYSCRNSLP